MLSRAYSTFQIKSVNSELRIIEGIASTPEVDRGGDSMLPTGARFKLPMPFRFKHQTDVGEVFAATVKPDGIAIKARVLQITEPGRLKDEIDYAWASIKHGLAKGLSIGWSPLKATPNKHGGVDVSEWEWLETSAVPIPMNASGTISSIKSIDSALLAASGTGRAVPSALPASRDSRKVTPMNVSEQITSEQNALQIKSARLEELMTKDQGEGGLEEAETTELNSLSDDVTSMTAKVKKLRTLEAAQASLASVVLPHPSTISTSAPRIEIVKKAYEKGTIFTRYAMAVAAGKGSLSDTLAYAKRFTDTPEVVAYIKATEGVATLNSPSWGSELVNANTAQTEFVELLRPMTIIGRIPGFRSIPFNIPVITQTGGSTFEWVGEAGAKPVGELAFTRTTLGWSKVAGIVVLTEELVRFSNPSAEATVRTDLTEQCAKFLDEQFIQVAFGGGASSPASVTYNVSMSAASGTDYTSLLADLNAALANFDSANISTEGLVIVTTPALARGIATLTTPLGVQAFPQMTPNGGTLLGYPVIVSASVDSGLVVILKPSEIFLADDGRVTLDASNQATLDMNGGSPASPTFNLWQKNCIGIRAERFIRWEKRRSEAVTGIDTASYGPSVGSP